MPRRPRTYLLHPGFRDRQCLLMLPANDGPDRDSFPHLILHTAGAIFANNHFDGWLSSEITGEPRLPESQTWLTAGDYYFHVPDQEGKSNTSYPIVPNFHQWRFPHANIPQTWQLSQQSQSSSVRSSKARRIVEMCAITGRQIPLQNAHIVPKSEFIWFGANQMDQYAELASRSGDSIADSIANCIFLTCDAHKLWDSGEFTLVPSSSAAAKCTSEAVSTTSRPSTSVDNQLQLDTTTTARQDGRAESDALSAKWQTFALNEHEELSTFWHARLIDLSQSAPEFLLARFAWDIFPKLHGFLHADPPEDLLVYSSDKGIHEVHTFTQKDRRKFTYDQGNGRSASRSQSPKKRVRSPQDIDSETTGSWAESAAGDHSTMEREKRRRLSGNPNTSQDSGIGLSRDPFGSGASDLSDSSTVSEVPVSARQECRGRKRRRS